MADKAAGVTSVMGRETAEAGKPAETSAVNSGFEGPPLPVEVRALHRELRWTDVYLAALTGLLAANRSDHRKSDGSLNTDKVNLEASAVADVAAPYAR